MSVSALLGTPSLSQSPPGLAGPVSPGAGVPGSTGPGAAAAGLTIGDLLAALSLPNFLPSTRICTRVVLPARTLSSWGGRVTTSLVFVADSARAKAAPPPLRTNRTRVLPLPGMKFLPLMVSFSPTARRIGLTPVTVGTVTGFFLAARALALSTSRALRSAPRQRTTRREFIGPYFGRPLGELEGGQDYRTPCGTTGRRAAPRARPRARPASAGGSPSGPSGGRGRGRAAPDAKPRAPTPPRS